MDLNIETISIMFNAVLIPTAAVLVKKLRDHAPAIIEAVAKAEKYQAKAENIAAVVSSVKKLVVTTEAAVADDNQIDAVEAAEILSQVQAIVNSDGVKELIEEFNV
jgi:hypothetical protein